jgi:hypothetical protein
LALVGGTSLFLTGSQADLKEATGGSATAGATTTTAGAPRGGFAAGSETELESATVRQTMFRNDITNQ